MKLLGRCKTCERMRPFIRKRTWKLPNSRETATNRDEICGRCAKAIRKLAFTLNAQK